MNVVAQLHGSYVHTRRVHRLGLLLAALPPPNARILDVGCGDGRLGALLTQHRPDTKVQGIDVLIRESTQIPVTSFDGCVIPHAEGSFDVVMLIDVLHHTDDPMKLLREARRVARQAIVIKDHTRNGLLANTTLRFMDYVGNARFGVALPYNYWRREDWFVAFESLQLKVTAWQDNLGLYPFPLDWVFGRSLHFLARLEPDDKGT